MNLKTRRKEAGLTQQELAAQLCVHQTAVAGWENGRAQPSIEKLLKLAEIFGCTVDELLRDGGEEEEDDDTGVKRVG